MAADNNFEAIERDHKAMWNAFVRFSSWATGAVVVALALMAIFLV
ncbi:aa3-type cytochrome c oxidase subunit IV [Stella sp.]